MEYKSSYDRINNISDIDYISRKICKEYCFGEYVGYQLIEIGYEDFNYILYTDYNKVFSKVLYRNKMYWFNSITIDKGYSSGIKKDSLVENLKKKAKP